MLNDLSCAVLDCSVEVTVTRHVSVALDKGRKTSARTEKFKTSASISPMTGQDLKRLGEGQMVEGSVLIISVVELFTAKSSECRIADRVEYRGIDYQISKVNDWSDLGNFYECVGIRSDR